MTSRSPRRPADRRPARRLGGLLAGLVALGALVAGPLAPAAGAHEGEAVVTIEAAHPVGTSVHYIVRVTWENDGHAAIDTTVTATGVAADGTTLTPVTLTAADSDGRYQGSVDYPEPGSWTVRVTAVDPTGSVEQAQQVAPAATTVPSDEGSETTTAPDGGFAPSDDGTGASDESAAPVGSDDGIPVYLIVAAVAVVLIGALTAVNLIRRTRAAATDGDATDGDTPDGDAPVSGDPSDNDRPDSASATSPGGPATTATDPGNDAPGGDASPSPGE